MTCTPNFGWSQSHWGVKMSSAPINSSKTSWGTFFFGELLQNFSLCWGGTTTITGDFTFNSSHTALVWGLRCQLASGHKGVFTEFLLFSEVLCFLCNLSPLKVKSYMGSLLLMLNNLWDHCHPCNITKMMKKPLIMSVKRKWLIQVRWLTWLSMSSIYMLPQCILSHTWVLWCSTLLLMTINFSFFPSLMFWYGFQ